MQKKIELLAPGGELDSIKAAILGGANAVYCGLDRFNARSRAVNINFADFEGIIRLAHSFDCQIFLTVNIIIVEREIPSLIDLLNKLVNTAVDGIIIQDLGLFYLINKYFNSLKIHASTQLTTHNSGQIEFLNKLSATRVNLCRELNLEEIKRLTESAHKCDMLTEVFVHGSYCISFSGICYLSSVLGGKSGNRGRCSQPCRDRYLVTPVGKSYPLNIKDNSAFFDLVELSDAGVDSLKIEGRIKKSDYVYTVTKCWRKQLDNFYKYNKLLTDNSDLYKVFNRDFSNSFLKGELGCDTFIDNPRSNSAQNLSEAEQVDLYDEKSDIRLSVDEKIKQLEITKTPLVINVAGAIDTPLKITVVTAGQSFYLQSVSNLIKSDLENLDQEMILKRFKALNNTEYYIAELNLSALQTGLFISFQELTRLKKEIQYNLNGQRKKIAPVNISAIKPSISTSKQAELAVLISSQDDLYLYEQSLAKIYFQLDDCFKNRSTEYVTLFSQNREIIPWFTSVLIGEDFDSAVEFLGLVKPEKIVTNNSGIAFEACKRGICWIAGPSLNLVNSYSLQCFKENFNCSGAFISNEINLDQIKKIQCPDDFKLSYSIYHPILLMTSRLCLFQQVTGCTKKRMDEKCLSECSQSATITNLNNQEFYIEKSLSNYHCLYNCHNFLNTDIINDLPNKFSTFLIDLRDVRTATETTLEKTRIISLFAELLNGNPDVSAKIRENIGSTTDEQYRKGI